MGSGKGFYAPPYPNTLLLNLIQAPETPNSNMVVSNPFLCGVRVTINALILKNQNLKFWYILWAIVKNFAFCCCCC